MNAHHKKVHKPSLAKVNHVLSTGLLSRTSQNNFEKSTKIERAIQRIPIGGRLSITLPTFKENKLESRLIEELTEAIAANATYYLCPAINLAELLEPEFMNSFIRNGSFIGLSETDSFTGDVICIDGKGRLVLNVSKDTYELLGLPGRPSKFGPRFVIEIDLRDDSFRLGKPGFERTKARLLNWPNSTSLFDQIGGSSQPSHKTFAMRFSFVSSEGKKGPIQFPACVESHLISPTVEIDSSTQCSIPVISTLLTPVPITKSIQMKQKKLLNDFDSIGSSLVELREWITLAIDGDQDDVEEEETEEEEFLAREGNVTQLQCDGFFHPSSLEIITKLVINQFIHDTAFLALNLSPPQNIPLSHIQLALKPIIGSRKKSNGKKARRGKGKGDDEEGDGTSIGWEIVVKKGDREAIEFATWSSI